MTPARTGGGYTCAHRLGGYMFLSSHMALVMASYTRNTTALTGKARRQVGTKPLNRKAGPNALRAPKQVDANG